MMANVEIDTDSDAQLRLLADSVQAFATKRLPLARARRLRRENPEFEAAMLAEMAGQGWTGLLIPESMGGFGLGFAEAAVIVEGLSAQLAPEPFVPVAVLGAGLLNAAAPGAQRDALLSGIADGSVMPACAWQDTQGGFDPAYPAFRARRAADGWIVEGEARFVRPGSGASTWLLVARTENGPVLFEAPLSAAGLDLSMEPQADGTALARVRAHGLCANEAMPLGADRLAAVLDQTLVMNAVELLALIRRMRSMTLEYLRTRVQFGKPIGSFQALQHRQVDLLLQEELTEAAVREAVAALDAGAPAARRTSLASRAKARAADAAMHTAREAIQMHGGIGVTDEYDLGLYVNRSLALAPWLGGARLHRQRWLALNPLQSVTES
ncbi:acyl-CoA dehydrogenase family protein [Algiphilus sp. W345]|uniref:Acyl-CoA dehydrogenase family protein n=1 Tax=Banduia mediterranea TaxID=3075609 RepID=A0ABU2WE80_9GAMM|nr:acyl-CoA dehydrogenase family protein [Algiphilus sp. W345]MDT0496174.1 acyl-CoA dehydrogenase family protein [Algiphilus sp. W345]